MASLDSYYPQFAELLRERTGQDVELVGHTMLERAVREGMALMRAKDPEMYLARLRSNRSTLQRFVNAMTIGESWFFRDDAPFEFLIQMLSRRASRNAGSGTIDLLSMPCASGEEAYSLAMTAHEAGLAADQCRIEGIDINTRYLRLARGAVYQGHALRGVGPDRLLRYFVADAQGHRVKDWLKQYVSFFHGSVTNPDARLLQRRYDIVLCRNLLIYLGAEARRQVLVLVRNLLKPDGLVIVGHAETGLMAAAGFIPEGTSHSFAFLRAQSAQPVISRTSVAMAHTSGAGGTATLKPGAATAAGLVKPSVGATLQEVEQLANAGHIEEAQQRCRWLLATSGNEPDVGYLCAIVAEAAGDEAHAEALLREVIKVCPEHYPALVHLAASLARRGVDNEACELRLRAQQLAESGGSA